MNRLIRPELIIQYYDRTSRDWRLRNELIDKRNAKHQSLNRHYGILDADGSVPTGKRGHEDANYSRQYDSIEAEFRPLYDRVSADQEQWLRSKKITIFEYLLLDNCMDEIVDLTKRAAQREGHFHDAIYLKATEFVAKLKNQYRIGGIKQKIEFEAKIHFYAKRRCRKFFEINLIDFSRQLDMHAYGTQWKAALWQAFNRLEAS